MEIPISGSFAAAVRVSAFVFFRFLEWVKRECVIIEILT